MKRTLLLLCLVVSPAPVLAQECAALQATVARIRANAPELADGTFQPFAPPPLPAEAHQVVYAGQSIFLPVASYRCVPHWNTTEKHMGVTLVDQAARSLLILGPMDGAAPMEDVFAAVGDAPAPPDRVEATRRLFGKTPNLFDLEAIAWSVDASKFACTPETVDVATRDAVALILKTIAAPVGRLAAHRDVGFAPSHLLVGTGEQRHTFDYRWQAGDRFWSMSATSPERAFIQAGTALVAAAPARPPVKVQPLSQQCVDVFELANAPSKARAEALKAKAAGDKKLVSALDAYLQTL